MKQYLKLLEDIYTKGVDKEDRTGTGTRSLFGYQMRFDLSAGFPLVTTKKLHLKSIVHELVWFLKGDTNIKYLQENGVKIWDDWADEDGDLGPVYGHNWRKWGSVPNSVTQPIPKLRDGVKPTYLGVANGSGKEGSILKKTWEGMIARCYDTNSISYPLYGGRGVSVCNSWLEFERFAQDSQNLINWDLKRNSPRDYVLDKDGFGCGFIYSPKSCQWVTPRENSLLKSSVKYTVRNIKTGMLYSFTSPTLFCEEKGIDNRNFSDLWTGNKNAKIRNGYEFVKCEDLKKGFDQIAWLINEIRENPDSRRLLLSAWNVSQLHQMALPPCHCLFQFYVANGKLSCQLYQRSGDAFIGIPFNIASYAILTHMIAQVCDLEVGDFVHTIGDAHIYSNHMEQVELQLTRDPMPLPKLWLNPEIKNIDDFKYEDIKVLDYNSHPHISAPVAV